MPSALSYPGVYIEELPSGVRTLTGVATSITAFVGYTRMGAPDKAVTITSFSDFERTYGGLNRDSPVSYGVRQFFANGGSQAIIVRVATGYASAAWTLNDDAAAAALTVTAASPGAWGNDLRIRVDRAGALNPDAQFNLIVSQLQADGTLAVLETHRNLDVNSASPRYVESVVNNASALVNAKRRSGLTFNQAGFAVSTAISFPLTATDTVIAGVVDGNTPFKLTLTGPTPTDMASLVTAVNAAIGTGGYTALLQASDSKSDGSVGSGCLKLASLTAGEASSVLIAGGTFGGLTGSIHLGLANGGREFTGNAQHRTANTTDLVPAAKGTDGTRAGATEIVGLEGSKTGIYALLDTDLFNILCIPETFDMSKPQAAAVITEAVNLCERRRAFYIADAPSGQDLPSIIQWAANDAPKSRNAAVYFPAVKLVDPLDELRPRAMAPSGSLAGVYARTDANRGVWKAPAGTDATLNGVLDLATPLNDLENGQINPKGVNALRNFPAYGRVAWGARTLKGSDAQADEYKYIPVRRLALFLEESLFRGTQWVVFEPNDEPLWAQVRLNIGAFMQGLFRQGAFQGKSSREGYFVKCDSETTTQNDINLGVLNVIVGFAPLKPAEFVVIQIQQMAGQIQS